MSERTKRKRVSRRGLTAYKVHELLTGWCSYPVAARYYDGYGDVERDHCADTPAENYVSDEMRQDWLDNREALLAFWRSGKYTTTEDLAEFGINVRCLPWLFVCGSRDTLPWAAEQFDTDDGLAGPTGRAGAAPRGRGWRSARHPKGARAATGE